MVLNFTILKTFSFFPGLCWKNKGFPLFLKNMARYRTMNMGDRIKKPRRDRLRSRNLFRNFGYTMDKNELICTNWAPITKQNGFAQVNKIKQFLADHGL